MKLRKLFNPRKRPRRPSPMMERIERIDETVGEIWRQLAEMKEQGNQRPSIVLGMPTENGAEITMLEPLEALEPVEGVSNDGE